MIYAISVPIKFFMFYHKYAKICTLMKSISSKLTETSMEQAKKNEHVLQVVAKTVCILTAITVLSYIYTLYLKTPRTFIAVFLQIVTLISGCTYDYTNLMLLFVYFNLCIQVCSLIKQIEKDLEDMKFVRDKKRVTEMLGEIVEFHNEVQQTVAELLDCFKNILRLNYVFSIWFIAQTLIYSSDSRWIEFAVTMPFLLFEALIYCYGSQKIITQVSVK